MPFEESRVFQDPYSIHRRHGVHVADAQELFLQKRTFRGVRSAPAAAMRRSGIETLKRRVDKRSTWAQPVTRRSQFG